MRLPKLPHTILMRLHAIQSKLGPIQMSRWVLLPMRLFLGLTFMYAGFEKLTNPEFFEPEAVGYIGKQILAFAQESPIHNLLVNTVAPNALLYGLLISYGEIAIGLGTLFGFLARPAAFFGLLISTMFFLSATWRVQPYFYGSDIVFMFCWLTIMLHGISNTGLPSLDEQFAQYFLQRTRNPKYRKWVAYGLSFLLGIPHIKPVKQPRKAWEPAQPDWQPTGKQTATLIRAPLGNAPAFSNRLSQPLPAVRGTGPLATIDKEETARLAFTTGMHIPSGQSRSARRTFLIGAFTGVMSTLGVTAIAYALRVISINNAQRAKLEDVPGVLNPTPVGEGTPGATVPTPTPLPNNAIAQATNVRLNSAVSFTIPKGNRPGILIHLNSDEFVAYDATCTHAGCLVDYDAISTRLVCPCHGAEYDPANQATVLKPPAPAPLKQLAIQINAATGDITLME